MHILFDCNVTIIIIEGLLFTDFFHKLTESLSYEINPFLNEEQSVIVMRAVVPGICPLHTHSFIEIACIEKGNGMNQVNQQLSRVKFPYVFCLL